MPSREGGGGNLEGAKRKKRSSAAKWTRSKAKLWMEHNKPQRTAGEVPGLHIPPRLGPSVDTGSLVLLDVGLTPQPPELMARG